MSRLNFSPGAFLLVFCVAYCVVFFMHWPLFLYYPMEKEFVWMGSSRVPKGPAMAWYGLMANAGWGALLAAVFTPRGKVETWFGNRLWWAPCVTMLFCVWLLRTFFQ